MLMANDIRWEQRFENYNRALEQLSRGIRLMEERPLSDLEKQGLIQGFEFTHELAWNVLKDYLEYEGIQGIVGSRGAVREAFRRGVIDDGEVWMDMIEKHNLSSHTYNMEVAEQVAEAVRNAYYPAFVALRERLAKEI
jgi:nucleotidyltransferase substrate binding protein (TIGR01987 family)